MHSNINILRKDHTNLYKAFRAELLFQIQGRHISSIFAISDRYINNFSELRYLDFNGSFTRFSRRRDI